MTANLGEIKLSIWGVIEKIIKGIKNVVKNKIAKPKIENYLLFIELCWVEKYDIVCGISYPFISGV